MGTITGYSIAYKSLGQGAYDYSFTLDKEFFSHFEGSEVASGNCGVEVQLQRGESMLNIDVEISGEVVVACDRCLEDCPVDIDYQGTLIVKFSDQIDEYDGDILWLSPLESQVDLAQYLYESVILSLPYQRVHADGECNEEMIRRFLISSTQAHSSEQNSQSANEPQNADEENADKERADKERADDKRADDKAAKPRSLSAAEMAKLQALKEKMEKQ